MKCGFSFVCVIWWD